MNEDLIIEKIQVPAGRRTYYIDVRKSREGIKYLKVCEGRWVEGTKKPQYQRRSVLIFEEDIKGVAAAITQAFTHFPLTDTPEQVTEEVKIEEEDVKVEVEKQEKDEKEKENGNFENAMHSWTEEEDSRLEQFYCQGKGPEELSDIFKRTPGAIESRIRKLELKMKYDELE